MSGFFQGTDGGDSVAFGDGADSVWGDSTAGASGNDSFDGGGGNDTLYGGLPSRLNNDDSGDDTLLGGLGNDWLYGGGGADSLFGGLDNDVLYGNRGSDLLAGGEGHDSLQDGGTAETFADTLLGDDGDDTLTSSGGADSIDGGSGTDLASIVRSAATTALNFTPVDSATATALGEGSTVVNVERFYIAGTSLADRIAGLAAADTLLGDLGDDTLDGASGNDRLDGGSGNDTLEGGLGDDTLLGGISGNDVLAGGDGADSLDDGAGINTADTLRGGEGDDTLRGSGGADLLDGGAGANDLAVLNRIDVSGALSFAPTGATTATLSGGTQLTDIERVWITGSTVSGGAADTLTGLAGNDTMHGNGGDDRLSGEAGNDSLIGGGGADSVVGGQGNDILGGGNDTVADTLLGGDGDDIIVGDTTDSIDGGAGFDQLSLFRGSSATGIVFAPADSATPYTMADGTTVVNVERFLIQGSNAAASGDSIAGLDADDSLYGNAGNDTLLGEGGNDRLDGGTGHDLLSGGDGDDTLDGNTGADTILGGDGDDSIFDGADGLTDNDSVLGGAGNDTIRTATGSETVAGGIGDDSIDVGGDNDLVIWRLGDGSDTIDLGGGSDTLDLEGWNAADTANDAWTLSVTPVPGGNTATFSGDASVGNAVLTVLNWNPGAPDTVVCFAEGTRIATARGEVAVEDLRIGDLALTMQGGAALRPIRWIGRSRVAVARHPRRAAVAPILIRAGALAAGVPARDLRVSPDHAMFLDGHLVPARHLVNGSSIVQELWRPAVTYWHVELDAHGLLISEGAVSESYFDDGNRDFFDNHAVTALVKDFASGRHNGRYHEAACAPVLQKGLTLELIRARITLRAMQAKDASRTGRADRIRPW